METISQASSGAPHDVHVVPTVCDLDVTRVPQGPYAPLIEQAILDYGTDQREGLEQLRSDAWPGIGVDEIIELLE